MSWYHQSSKLINLKYNYILSFQTLNSLMSGTFYTNSTIVLDFFNNLHKQVDKNNEQKVLAKSREAQQNFQQS